MGTLDPGEIQEISVNVIVTSGGVFSSFDQVENSDIIGAGDTETLITLSGTGFAQVVIEGDGDADVQLFYNKDGNGPVLMGVSDNTNQFPISFQSSLVITATNTNVSDTKSYSTIEAEGMLVSS